MFSWKKSFSEFEIELLCISAKYSNRKLLYVQGVFCVEFVGFMFRVVHFLYTEYIISFFESSYVEFS